MRRRPLKRTRITLEEIDTLLAGLPSWILAYVFEGTAGDLEPLDVEELHSLPGLIIFDDVTCPRRSGPPVM